MAVWWKSSRIPGAKTLMVTATIFLMMYFVLFPLAMVLLTSIKGTKDRLFFEDTPFTLQNYVTVYLEPSTYALLFNTLIFAGGTMFVGMVLSVFFAWLVERTDMPGRNLVYTMMLLPMAIPGLLTSMGWVLLLSPRIGFINTFLRSLLGLSGDGPFNIYSLAGMIFVSGLSVIPTSFLMLVGAFRSMDPSLEEAGAISGCGVLSTVRRITIPLMMPALISTFIYKAIQAIESFEVPLVIGTTAGIRVFSTGIYYAIHPDSGLPDYGMASALAMIIMALSTILIIIYGRMIKRADEFAIITGKGYRPRLIRLGAWKYVGLSVIILFLCLKVFFPFFILFWGSLLSYYTPPSAEMLPKLSFAVYRTLWEYPGLWSAVTNTIILGVASGITVMLLSSLVAWIIVRMPSVYSRALDIISFLPHTIPGVVLGLSVMLMYLWVPVPIYGTIWIIVIAVTTNYLAFGVRTMVAAQVQIHRELEDAAEISGASWGKTFQKIVLPLLFPSLVNGWLWVFLHAVRGVSIVFMLAIIKNRVLTNILWTAWTQGDVPAACALSVMLVIVQALLIFAGRLYVTQRLKTY